MTDLLQLALEAHGGVKRWNELHEAEAKLSIGGALWELQQKADLFKNIHIQYGLHEQWMTTELMGDGRRMVFTRDRMSIETATGDSIETLDAPRASFSGQPITAQWNDLQAGYFNSYALWTYLTIPFLYAQPGFTREELTAWEENDEIWRPLKVTFPPSIATHTKEQISYFGQDCLLRRHQYTVDVLGRAKGLNYAYNYCDFDGIAVPTCRRVYAYDENRRKVPESVLVAIDIEEVHFH